MYFEYSRIGPSANGIVSIDVFKLLLFKAAPKSGLFHCWDFPFSIRFILIGEAHTKVLPPSTVGGAIITRLHDIV